MKNTLIPCLLMFLTTSVFAQQWTVKASMPTPRNAMGLVSLNNKIYAIGGSNGVLLTNNEVYNPATDTWSQLAPMSVARTEMAIGVVSGKIYVIGGYNLSGALNVVEAYDPATNTWITKTPMPTSRSQTCMAVINDKIYVVGGWLGQYATLEVYDPATDTWTTKAPLAHGMMQDDGGVAYNNKFYVIGGKNYDGTAIYDSTHVYDPATNVWSVAANMPQASFAGATALLNNKIHYMGGSPDNFANQTMYNTHYVYDPTTNTWTTGLAMLSKRAMHAAAVVNGKMYVIGGQEQGSTGASALNEEYSEPGLGIDNVVSNDQFSFYPNPAKDIITISAPENGDTKRAVIIDLNGRNIASYIFSGRQFTIHTTDLATGTYLLVMNDGSHTEVKELIITH